LNNTTKQYVRYLVSIASLIGLVVFIRWAGMKGIISFFLGMTVMAALFLSKNMMIRLLVDKFSGTEYVDQIRGKP